MNQQPQALAPESQGSPKTAEAHDDMMDMAAQPNGDTIHRPIPQRRYAFIFANEVEQRCPPASTPARPVSAPAVFPFLHDDIAQLERPSSPLSRVANPMVRDNHFRRINLHARRPRLPHPPQQVAAPPSSAAAANAPRYHHYHHQQQAVPVTPSD